MVAAIAAAAATDAAAAVAAAAAIAAVAAAVAVAAAAAAVAAVAVAAAVAIATVANRLQRQAKKILPSLFIRWKGKEGKKEILNSARQTEVVLQKVGCIKIPLVCIFPFVVFQ